MKGLCPLVQALEACGSKPELQQVKELLTDSFELLAHASMDINLNRRETLRPDWEKSQSHCK